MPLPYANVDDEINPLDSSWGSSQQAKPPSPGVAGAGTSTAPQFQIGGSSSSTGPVDHQAQTKTSVDHAVKRTLSGGGKFSNQQLVIDTNLDSILAAGPTASHHQHAGAGAGQTATFAGPLPLDASPTSRPRLPSPTKQQFEKKMLKMNHSLSASSSPESSCAEVYCGGDVLGENADPVINMRESAEFRVEKQTPGEMPRGIFEYSLDGFPIAFSAAPTPGQQPPSTTARSTCNRTTTSRFLGSTFRSTARSTLNATTTSLKSARSTTRTTNGFNSTTRRQKQVRNGQVFRWIKGDPIGCGSLGTCFRALDTESGKLLAVKEISLHDATDKTKESLQAELDSYKTLQHARIVDYLGHEVMEDSFFIYLEYMAGGSLAHVIQVFGPLEEALIAAYCLQLLEGLAYLHSKNFIHRDIKGGNILVGLEREVKLSDFGCAKQIMGRSGEMCAQTMTGSIPWMSPEVMKGSGYGTKADIWSLGCLAIEMASGQPPWSEKTFDNNIAMLMKIAMSDEIPAIPDHLSGAGRDFVAKCLTRDVELRPTAEELLTHPFVAAAGAG
eukprot:g18891.t1